MIRRNTRSWQVSGPLPRWVSRVQLPVANDQVTRVPIFDVPRTGLRREGTTGDRRGPCRSPCPVRHSQGLNGACSSILAGPIRYVVVWGTSRPHTANQAGLWVTPTEPAPRRQFTSDLHRRTRNRATVTSWSDERWWKGQRRNERCQVDDLDVSAVDTSKFRDSEIGCGPEPFREADPGTW